MSMRDNDDRRRATAAPVVVGVDGSPGAEAAVRWAAETAVRRARPLRIVHGMDLVTANGVLGVYAVMAPPVVDSVRAHGRAVVARAEKLAREMAPGVPISTVVTADSGKHLLIEHSVDAYAVVLGATGTAGTLAHFGSTLLAVTARAQGTVVVVRTDRDADGMIHDAGPVVVGVDGSPVSEAAIVTAFGEAADRGAELVAVHAWSDWDYKRFAADGESMVPDAALEEAERAVLAERLAGWQEKYPDVLVTRKIYLASPAAHLRDWSKRAQLVVIGSRGRGALAGALLGSTANSLVQHAYCPVMVVHPIRVTG
ncbi:nucleotide-binding universal stress UspA family protein [Nocardia transvalensis]|uniref:Nucleotide-binding universal stress UspA family protein n=1 Tax=Nocardia transvalensis TaxID=37333 RepID=A0A7W9UL26_9NOCA|nr:universal stress protein [Nocardia transvalensis]MBB5916245.1 nucleotide-binding universal stress UspA family protein [Nocardia transvalensis]